ncbi:MULTISPECIES: hypothetical protein [Bacillota]|uniref:hypothetical protein n=1 Tax=Bacillota TaxID=1239 RepID=UPI001C2B9BAA|nr:hypothetical protein [Thomasclavelia ramosa]MBU9876595.1 hypothetical protein [Thomasclavelia ramosa]MBV4096583.1 hypothetical protein [Thomasclavelia ramosa]MBV4118555.1 hypothetical protein [Thomasclavelia ramosa]
MEFDSPNDFKYHMIEMLIILIGSFILSVLNEDLFNNERYYKEYELINVVNDDSAGRKDEITYAYIDKNDEIHFWYKDENNELVKSTYKLDKVKIYETNIEKPVAKFGYDSFNEVISVELSISRDYIE